MFITNNTTTGVKRQVDELSFFSEEELAVLVSRLGLLSFSEAYVLKGLFGTLLGECHANRKTSCQVEFFNGVGQISYHTYKSYTQGLEDVLEVMQGTISVIQKLKSRNNEIRDLCSLHAIDQDHLLGQELAELWGCTDCVKESVS